MFRFLICFRIRRYLLRSSLWGLSIDEFIVHSGPAMMYWVKLRAYLPTNRCEFKLVGSFYEYSC